MEGKIASLGPNLRPASGDAARAAVLDATAEVVSRIGFHDTTIDHVVRESGVSRATLYRWFGNRDGLLLALLQHLAGPYLEQGAKIAVGLGPIEDRLEQVIAGGIESICNTPWIHKVAQDGLLHDDFSIFLAAHKSITGALVRSMFDGAIASGGWAPPDDLDRLIEWLLHQMLVLGAEDYDDPLEIRRRVAIYVMPVLNLPAPPGGAGGDIAARLERIERKIDGLDR
ncbi:TetR/AcrR family transcriptional regulator [Sphingopyxis sp. OPL5]|uniref:TetR/AcrR family transcriptional regulator n=1 Tax=Sphingopyxis sp. OPL5 TaxID=2486273 RepID=UPI00164DA3D7|nr:TetR/AcrR family transcriptional regulator [Sphingopyxis sp. OPL5]QNO26536.1 TetR/AcrR family transcriptional regulator [Sphingopyxis sp. OPL5]